MESKQIFREKSLERVSSPEQLDDYIKVTTPSVWIILVATVVLLSGMIIWGVFGKIEINTPNGVEVVAPIDYVVR
ncbi:MAG: hypothetical protein K6E90_06895 [Lachnospiraceae bacterium]|nr:hypothetical protein [Lachnospiraceae bacterium]